MTTLAPSFFIGSSSFLQATRTLIKSRMGSKLGSIRRRTYELPTLELLEKSIYCYNGKNVATTLVLSILNGSSSFLQTTKATIKAWMSLNFVKIPSHNFILELTPLEHLKKITNNVVTTLAPSFLIGSSLFLQATSKPIISQMGSKFSRI